MANKTTNKRTNNNYQTGNNKNSKRTSLLKSKFNLQSRKVQFFVIILIIAIIGGGYFTFKSFANPAIPGPTIATLNAQSMTPILSGNSYGCSGVGSYSVADNRKASGWAWVLSGKNSCIGSTFKPSAVEGSYQICALVTGTGQISFPTFGASGGSYWFSNMWGYSQVCSSPVYRPRNRLGQIVVKNNSTTGPFRVGLVTVIRGSN